MASRFRRDRGIDFWPGFVDALSTFLLSIIFLLSVFMLAQYFLSRELAGKDEVLVRLNRQINELSSLLALEQGDKSKAQGEVSALSTALAALETQKKAAESALETSRSEAGRLTGRLSAFERELDSSRRLSNEATAQVDLLNQQIAALRRQLAAVEEALGIERTKEQEAQARIADLGNRLNLALAQKVQELSRYRSEFFGRLRDVLAGRDDVRVVGDRFVFSTEVLFAPGGATLEPDGLQALDRVAQALVEISKSIPADIPWVLRVDGHTDKRPIASPQFPSNWELSTARAIAVVRHLQEKGIPTSRLVAAGFAEFQPIDPGDAPEQLARNRRIELKLTER